MPDAHPSRTRHAIRPVHPQPRPPAWSAALLPSQRRAAEYRAAEEHQRAAQRWLRELIRH
jgi:hypothetical protein